MPAVVSTDVELYLIEILHQTTTAVRGWNSESSLYLIEILHQTTTVLWINFFNHGLYLIEILHQTTTRAPMVDGPLCCILSKFYIKPQQFQLRDSSILVVSYRNSTSNHNWWASSWGYRVLYLIEILHQTTTGKQAIFVTISCILSKFYIKPQPFKHAFFQELLYLIEILHQTTTIDFINARDRVLYLIEILHQTTTSRRLFRKSPALYLIEILHQTTTLEDATAAG